MQERVALWVVFSFIPARLAHFFKSDYNESDFVSPKSELLAQSHQDKQEFLKACVMCFGAKKETNSSQMKISPKHLK